MQRLFVTVRSRNPSSVAAGGACPNASGDPTVVRAPWRDRPIRIVEPFISESSADQFGLNFERRSSAGTSAADFVCKDCVNASAAEIRKLRVESPMRLFRQLTMTASADKPMISVVPEVGVEPTRF